MVTDFDTTNNAVPFPVTYGATLSTECGVLSSGRSLVFKYDMLILCLLHYNCLFQRYGRTREIQTEDLDTTQTLYIQFVFASSRSCGGFVTSDNTLILQFSLDKGITWNDMHFIGQSLQSSTGIENYHIVIPPEAKYPQTRFRIWQPSAAGNDYDMWSIDDFLIGGIDMNTPMIVENFDSIGRDKYVIHIYPLSAYISITVKLTA